MSWKRATLSSLGSVGRGKSRHRPRNDPTLYGGQYPFFQTGDVTAAEFHLSAFSQTYNDKGLAQSKIWEPDTLCITIAANIAETAILKVFGCFPDSIVGFVADPNKSDVRFVKYALDMTKRDFQVISKGTTQDNLSVEKMLSITLPVPPLAIQRRIADILSAHDDLIENNTKRIAILEEAARRLFAAWHRKKRDGSDGHGVIDEAPFSALAEFSNGFPFKPTHLGEEGLPVVKIPELQRGVTNKTPRSQHLVPARNHIDTGDLLFSWSGTLAVSFWVDGPALLNQHLFRVSPKNGTSAAFLLVALRNSMPKFLSEAVGATMKHIRRGTLDTVRCPVPDDKEGKRLCAFLDSTYGLVNSLRQSNVLLRAGRDLLLPKLISGEIEVCAAQEALEDAAG